MSDLAKSAMEEVNGSGRIGRSKPHQTQTMWRSAVVAWEELLFSSLV
jgi:hypothetical protein